MHVGTNKYSNAMINELKQIATDCGADRIIYDRPSMQNILVDETIPGLIVCMIDELNQVDQQYRGNGIDESMTIIVSWVKQVDHGEEAEMNREVLNELLVKTRKYLIGLTDSGLFRKNITSRTVKFRENIMDANLIGWQMTINVSLLYGYTEC